MDSLPTQDTALRAALLAIGIVLVAFLVGRFAPQRRKKIRRAVVPFVLWIACLALRAGFSAAQLASWADDASFVAALLQYLTVINLTGIAVFDLALPIVRLAVPDIVAELSVGAAYVVSIIAVLRGAGVNLSGIVATSAVVTGVLGLSLQATLGNILGGVALQLDDSIHVGDWIQLENGRQGRVTEIRWRHTVVETRDWDTIIVPNASLLAQNITILGKRHDQPQKHRMWIYFNVDFRYAPAEVLKVVNAALAEAPIENVAQEPAPHAIVFDFARDHKDSFTYYAIRYWLTDLAKDDPTSSLVRLRLYAALRRASIPLAVPATTVFVSHDDPDHARRKENRELERRIAALDGVELFDPMTPEEKARIAPRIRYAPFAKGEIITRQGATAHWLYVLTKGDVEVRLHTEQGDDTVASTIHAPGFFGEMGVMTGAKRSSTIVALTEVECFRIDKDDVHLILQARPEIADGISNILAERQVALLALREGLAASDRQSRVDAEHGRILSGIRTFFGLGDTLS